METIRRRALLFAVFLKTLNIDAALQNKLVLKGLPKI